MTDVQPATRSDLRSRSDPTSGSDAQWRALRGRPYRMATATSLITAGLMFVAYLLGVLSTSAFIASAAAILVFVGGFYAVFRSGFNRRFADQSLSLAQMVAAASVVLCTMYAAQTGHGAFLLLLLMVFMFGVPQLTRRALLLLALLMLAGQAVVSILLWRDAPERVNLGVEFLQWLVFALALPWFAWMGGYIGELRTQLSRRNLELSDALRIAKAGEANLEEAQRIARLGMWIVDPVSRQTTWSAEAYRLWGVDPALPVPTGSALLRLIHVDDQQRYNELIRPAILEGRSFEGEFRIALPGGGVRWVQALGRPVLDDRGETVIVRGTIRDITEQREADEHIRHLAHFDLLTGLPNRSLFTQLIERALAQAKRRASPLAILFIDLDGFKEINDRLGHNAGDALLAAFASRLASTSRKSDATGRLRSADSAARLGGDEFVVLIDDFEDVFEVVTVARRILAATSTPFHLEGGDRYLTASIGIAVYPDDGETLDSLMKSADSAMYAAKQTGKNDFRFYSRLFHALV